jgi:hypothetical protein
MGLNSLLKCLLAISNCTYNLLIYQSLISLVWFGLDILLDGNILLWISTSISFYYSTDCTQTTGVKPHHHEEAGAGRHQFYYDVM